MENKLIFLAALLILALLILTNVGLSLNKPIETRIIDVRFKAGNKMGIIMNSSEINFGVLLPGMSSSKEILISNNFKSDVKIIISVDKGIQDYAYGQNVIFLKKKESVNYTLNIRVPEEIEYNTYAGKIRFDIYKK